MMLASHLKGTPEEHVAWLENRAELPQGARVMDAGCGVGEVSRLLAELRPDLKFLLVNTDTAQLAKCPPGMPQLLADFAATGLPQGSFDGILFSWAFGYGPGLAAKLQECAWLLKPGGKLLLWEPSGIPTVRAGLFTFHKFSSYRPGDVLEASRRDFRLRLLEFPETSTKLVEEVAAAAGETPIFEATFSKIRPYLLILERK